jgi:hypothetical protein
MDGAAATAVLACFRLMIRGSRRRSRRVAQGPDVLSRAAGAWRVALRQAERLGAASGRPRVSANGRRRAGELQGRTAAQRRKVVAILEARGDGEGAGAGEIRHAETNQRRIPLIDDADGEALRSAIISTSSPSSSAAKFTKRAASSNERRPICAP